MRPIQLGGHSRPITRVRVNRDGDLLFTCGKDNSPMVWFVSNGERLGTYDGHNGSIFDLDVDFHSKYVLTAGADCKFGIWGATDGKNIVLQQPLGTTDRCTCVKWNCGSKKFLVATIGFKKAYLMIYDFKDVSKWLDLDKNQKMACESQIPSPPPSNSSTFTGHTKKITEALWSPRNKFIYTASEDGTIRKWDVEKKRDVQKTNFNDNSVVIITSLSFSKDRTLLIASGTDNTARLFEADTLLPLKKYTADKPLNCAAIHPNLNLVMVAGGQAARDVTTTTHRSGKFEVQFFHQIFEEKIGEIKTGHFSPINAMCCTVDGSHFITGAEEGNCRIFKFDADFNSKFRALEQGFVELSNKK